jgi:hypothetical protein
LSLNNTKLTFGVSLLFLQKAAFAFSKPHVYLKSKFSVSHPGTMKANQVLEGTHGKANEAGHSGGYESKGCMIFGVTPSLVMTLSFGGFHDKSKVEIN